MFLFKLIKKQSNEMQILKLRRASQFNHILLIEMEFVDKLNNSQNRQTGLMQICSDAINFQNKPFLK